MDDGLGGWPLPALADDCALHATRTKGLLQSGQKTLERRLVSIRIPVFRKTLERRLGSIRFPVFRSNTGKKTEWSLLFGVLFKHQRLEALADAPALGRDRIT
jgi:hypothetical protein